MLYKPQKERLLSQGLRICNVIEMPEFYSTCVV